MSDQKKLKDNTLEDWMVTSVICSLADKPLVAALIKQLLKERLLQQGTNHPIYSSRQGTCDNCVMVLPCRLSRLPFSEQVYMGQPGEMLGFLQSNDRSLSV